MTDDAQDEPPGQPVAPFTPEDGAYAAVVSEFLGLQRAGADVLGAALITAAHLFLMGVASQQPAQVPD